jgi:Domain of unknown function (DUF3854)
VPLWITEGAKCGDSITSRARCTISLIGVWMSRKPRSAELLPCFDSVALRGRRVYVVFDSDVMHKPEVALALERLVSDLEDRGARVLVVYLPDAPDGSKLGVDDYLAAGGTVEHLEEIARPFTRQDAARERMTRDERLREGVAQLWRTWEAQPWRGIGGHTRREVLRAMIAQAARSGKAVAGGVQVEIAQRTLAERAGVSHKAVKKALRNLAADDLIRRDDAERRAEEAPAAYILLTPGEEGRARGTHNGKEGGWGEEKHHTQDAGISGGYDPGGYPTRALAEIKRLRWSYVARVWTENGYDYEFVRRLGKIAGRVLEALVGAGGVGTVAELADAVGHKRARDLVRDDRKLVARPVKVLADRTLIEFERVGRVGAVVRLADAGLARIESDTVILADDWPEKLGLARELGEEYDAERRTNARHEAARRAYRQYRERGETLSADELARARREKQRARREAREARRQHAREAARELRPNHWAWRERQHLADAGADGYVGEIVPEPVAAEPGEAAERKLPPMVDGIYQHGALCDCAWCSEAPQPSYATVAG